MDNSSMAMLSMEPRKQIITPHNNYCLTSYAISYRHFTWLQKCCKSASKPNVAHITIPSKKQKPFWACAMCTLTTYNKHNHWDPILAAVSVFNMYIVHDNQLYLNGLDAYTSCTVHEQDSMVTRHECAIQLITYIANTCIACLQLK